MIYDVPIYICTHPHPLAHSPTRALAHMDPQEGWLLSLPELVLARVMGCLEGRCPALRSASRGARAAHDRLCTCVSITTTTTTGSSAATAATAAVVQVGSECLNV